MECNPGVYIAFFVFSAGTPRLTGTGLVRILVQDANDNAPRFHHDMYEFTVKENVPIKSLVGHVTAMDLDEGLNAKLRLV